MTTIDPIELKNIDDEEVFDVVNKLEKSFDIKFSRTAFFNVKTFGDLCDIIQAHIDQEYQESCTKQQAFHKIRKAIGETLPVTETPITPASDLSVLFPPKKRRQQIKAFEDRLGIKVNILTSSAWLSMALEIGLLLSFLAFFIDWKIALSGIAFFMAAFKIAGKLAKDLNLQTVRQLTEKVVIEHYAAIRRTKGTVNRNEILETIKTAFSSHLAIDKKYLTADASFNWA
jgi:acyl carrier protein